MKKLPLAIVGLLVIGCVLVITRGKDRDAETPEPVELDRGEAPGARLSATETTDDADYEFDDTLIMIGGKALGWGFTTIEGIEKYALLYDTVALTVDPTVRFSAQSPSTFIIDTRGRKARFDVNSATCIQDLEAFLGPIPGYLRYQKDYCRMEYVELFDTLRPILKYIFVLDYPDTADAQNGDIMPWLASLVERAQTMDDPVTTNVAGYLPKDSVKYVGKELTGKSLGDHHAKAFIDGMPEDLAENCPWGFEMTVDLRARASNDRYVTYRSYVHSHETLTHGMYTEYMHTYDRKNKREVDYDYLFKHGTTDKVLRLLYEVMAADTTFTKSLNLEPTTDVIERWAINYPMGNFDDPSARGLQLAKPALTDEGIVFSFQPYEIDCFAAGAYHFTIPYAKARPYLTKQALTLVGI